VILVQNGSSPSLSDVKVLTPLHMCPRLYFGGISEAMGASPSLSHVRTIPRF